VTLELACPRDRGALRPRDDGSSYDCPSCEARYPVERGIVRFLAQDDAFYEDHYADWVPTRFVPRSESLRHAWPLWLIKSGYLWAARKHVPEGGLLLEVGCGSGIAYFGRRFRAVGVDVAQSSLVKVLELYDACLQADIAEPMPMPDGSADAIANSFLWEHLPPEVKPRVLEEWHRVLRPGGKVVLLYDVVTRNPLLRRLRRRDPELYREVYIEREHHYGYQTPAENRELFERHGFRVLEHRGMEKTPILSPSELQRIGNWGGWTKAVAAIGRRLSRPPLLYPYTAFVRVSDTLLGPLLPLSWGRTALSVLERR
jgi:SAM-dependent methyltransferase